MDVFNSLVREKKYEIEYNGETSGSHGVVLSDYPSFSGGSKHYDTYQVPGRIGELVGLDEYTGNVTITCKFAILSKRFSKRVEDIRQWLRGTGKLVLSDDKDLYYKVQKVEYGSIEREIRTFGSFQVDFVCDPYAYEINGQYPHTVKDVLWNPYDEAHPAYMVTGNGEFVLKVNGHVLMATSDDNMIIDTDMMLAYKESQLLLSVDENGTILANSDGALIKMSDSYSVLTYYTSGNYEDLYLIPGENQINITEGFGLSVIPNWGYEL